MLGFCLALIFTKGILLLPVLLSLAAFLLMVTALTYQLQGWLAALMSNPRRRRTVIVGMTAGFVLIAQLPNLINFVSPWGIQQRVRPVERIGRREFDEAGLALLNRGKFDASRARASTSRKRHPEAQACRQQADRESMERWEQTARLANMVLPVGWLPLGVMSAAEGNVLPSILGLLGMTLIGTGSLWRAYRTTIRTVSGAAHEPERAGRRPPVRIAGDRTETRRAAARSTYSRRVGTGFGHRAGRLSLASAVARGEDDVAVAGDHDPHFRLHDLQGTCGYSGVGSAAGRHRRDAPSCSSASCN